MTKSSIKRFSILGLILFTASAVTAAIVSNTKTDDSNLAPNGSLTTSSDNRPSCTATNGNFDQSCFNTDTFGNSAGGTSEGAYVSVDASTAGDDVD